MWLGRNADVISLTSLTATACRRADLLMSIFFCSAFRGAGWAEDEVLAMAFFFKELSTATRIEADPPACVPQQMHGVQNFKTSS